MHGPGLFDCDLVHPPMRAEPMCRRGSGSAARGMHNQGEQLCAPLVCTVQTAIPVGTAQARGCGKMLVVLLGGRRDQDGAASLAVLLWQAKRN